ncbi:MAG: pyridoxamine 5'-phosphate oxidase family protein [Leptolyngbya sp.]|nr:pyridoxamine 5'-phosphate oxidase family protein [Candidatus Melainabacteria bacterium]
MKSGPFHKGEIEVQKRAGEAARARANGAVIRSEILEGALSFIARQPLVAVGTAANDGSIWASVIFGAVGFMRADDTHTVHINLEQGVVAKGDPVLENLAHDSRIGTLMIELETRRRLKINGRAALVSNNLVVSVEKSFPLCPKYIQRRIVRLAGGADSCKETSLTVGIQLGLPEVELISDCDTLFVASSYADITADSNATNIDVSHRGGHPGFAEVVSPRCIRVPDYAGNGMFNTFGNLQLNKRAGVIFIDFAKQQALQITGFAEVLFDQEDSGNQTGGTNRFWTLEIERWQRFTLSGIEVEFLDYSPFNL